MKKDLHQLMNSLVPLREEEQELRKQQLLHPELCQNEPYSADDYQKLVNRLPLQSSQLRNRVARECLEECDFFRKDEDVAIFQTFRYLPAMWHQHAFMEILYVLQGTCQQYFSDHVRSMQAGDVCLIAPGVYHALSAQNDETVVLSIDMRATTFEHAFFGILSEDDVFSNFFRHILYHSPHHPYLLFSTDDDTEVRNFVLYAYMEYVGSERYRRRMLNNVLMAFFTVLLRNHEAEVIMPSGEISYGSDTFLAMLDAAGKSPSITLGELAQMTGYSERQVQRIIKAATGCSYREWLAGIRSKKMQEAARLLASTDLPVQEIACRCGYKDAAGFRKAFGACYQTSPSRYRAEHSQGCSV